MKSLKAKFRKTDVNEWNKNDERLLAAVEHGEVDKLASLLAKKGASAVKLDSEGKSALHVAASRGQIECLSVLLSHGADWSVPDAAGLGPLHLAAKNNHVECCRKLIQSKCPVDCVDGSGKTALHHAAAGGKIQAVQLLCELKSPINLRDADGLTPLLLSAKHGHADVCCTLLDLGAELHIPDNNCRTALMLAAECGSVSVVDALVQRGADLTALDSQGHDVLHFSKLGGNSEVNASLTVALNRQASSGTKSPKSPLHDQVAKLSDERLTTPKKRKAPPPPISPPQNSGPNSPAAVNSTGTPTSNKSDTQKPFNYKQEDEVGDEYEKRQQERNMLLAGEDMKQTVEPTVTGPELDVKVERAGAAHAALQAKIAELTQENRQLSSMFKKHLQLQGKECSNDDHMNSNASFHSVQDELATPTCPSYLAGNNSAATMSDLGEAEESELGRAGGWEEIRLLRQALESVQMKLLESRKENRSLQAQLKPEQGAGGEDESGRVKGREEELMESLAELQAKLTDTQERYHQALEEVEGLRAQMGGEGEPTERQEEKRGMLEEELRRLKTRLAQFGLEQEQAAQQIRLLQEERRRLKEEEQRSSQVEELYKEAQEEIRMLQEALQGTVPVEAAAKDFEEMKAELSEVNSGLQRRLLELSHSYSEAKNQLSTAQKQLAEAQADTSGSSSPSSGQQADALKLRLEELQALLAEAEKKNSAAQQEISQLRQEAEAQAQNSIALADHLQVMSSLGNAIKELESQVEALTEQLQQKTLQVESLQKKLPVESEVNSEESVSSADHMTMRQQLESEVNDVTQLLQEALRKQDDMALEAAGAWQKARESRAECEALQEVVKTTEDKNQSLTSRLAESQDAVCQLKQVVENHVASEREKNKRIDDLSREVGKLKDALNSLSQLSYSSSSPSKRQQQSQQLETLQQQVKQLQYQLAESKKQHHEIVSVYRMHLLYAVQGQMDEDVQKALKQILMMCKMPSPTKEAC
ncbi:ankycorbin isoform X1 [Synchiropus splendidus]|uniref:ankycorbin isoform X1 n=1 Tax=Synchiropus splendidus TaxID=270530 RepID=UPI00237E3539|nr:ankycorbin isoform X1 [Synchiropus splendidus]XP_053700834.1 ankycorbin isoform X1 [Synchiropus splendidus]